VAVPWLARAIRAVYRREQIPVRLRWWFVADGMAQWFRLMRTQLDPHLGGDGPAGSLLAALHAPVLERGYDRMRAAHRTLPDRAATPRAVGLVMGTLYRVTSNPQTMWLFEPLGGGPVSFADHVRAERWLGGVPLEARWAELTNHLGEMLIALTEGLPAHIPRAPAILGDICFAAGTRVGRKMRKAFELPSTAAAGLEVLRMTEYLFRVQPEHWIRTDPCARTGFIAGNGCPWYTAPGFNVVHCGIFGQFQAGMVSVFGLRYTLTRTIPKDGGHTCRIDVRPIPLRTSEPSRHAPDAPADFTRAS
jgi:hypothetical protein